MPVQMPRFGLCRCCRLIDASPGAGEPFDVGSGSGLGKIQQRGLVVGRGHAGQRPDLGVGNRPALHRRAQPRQGRQCVGDTDLLARAHRGQYRYASVTSAHTRRSRRSSRCDRRTHAAARGARRWRHAGARRGPRSVLPAFRSSRQGMATRTACWWSSKRRGTGWPCPILASQILPRQVGIGSANRTRSIVSDGMTPDRSSGGRGGAQTGTSDPEGDFAFVELAILSSAKSLGRMKIELA